LHRASINEAVSVRYAPNADFNGTGTFTYTVSHGGPDKAAVRIEVLPDKRGN